MNVFFKYFSLFFLNTFEDTFKIKNLLREALTTKKTKYKKVKK